MKYRILLCIFLAGLLTACGSERNTLKNIPKEQQAFDSQFQTVSENPAGEKMSDLLFLTSLAEPDIMTPTPETPMLEMDPDDVLSQFLGVKTDWPAEFLHPDMPPYHKGKINGWNSWGENEYDIFILIEGTSQQELDEYVAQLKERDFYENGRRFCKGPFYVEFQFNSTNLLQISSYKEDVLEWPDDILGFMPPLEKGLMTGITKPTENEPYGDLYFIGLTEEDIKEWEEELIDEGFEVDYGSYRKENVKLNGKTYKEFSASFQGNGTNEWILYFFFNNE